jgi:ribosome-associated protein
LPDTPPSPSQPEGTTARLSSEQCARLCADLAADRRAEDIVILDLRGLSSVADFFLVASADADVQLRAVSDRIEEGLAAQGERVYSREGYENGQWIVLDFVDVVCHLFLKEKREFYQLERLWGDAPRLALPE